MVILLRRTMRRSIARTASLSGQRRRNDADLARSSAGMQDQTPASRATVEYVLSVAAWIQCEFTNGDVYAPDGNFQQVVLRDADFGGMYSIWFTPPPGFAAGDYAFQGSPEDSSLFHEMGHNFTLNSPVEFCYGGKIDGWANAIFSETMAQIFAHATAFARSVSRRLLRCAPQEQAAALCGCRAQHAAELATQSSTTRESLLEQTAAPSAVAPMSDSPMLSRRSSAHR
jgi:hypothetical protein